MSFPQAVPYSLLGDLSKKMPGISDITTAVKDSIIKATDKTVEETIKIGGKIVEKTVEEVTKSAGNIAETGVKSGIAATSDFVKTGIDTLGDVTKTGIKETVNTLEKTTTDLGSEAIKAMENLTLGKIAKDMATGVSIAIRGDKSGEISQGNACCKCCC